MMPSQLYDFVQEVASGRMFEGCTPSWYYLWAKYIIRIHLCDKIETVEWRLR